MNLLLQDPFSVLKEYPEKLTQCLQNPLRTECIRFSPYGDYLAAGCSNGGVIIYDMDTYRPLSMLGSRCGAHTRPIQALEWSPCGRYLLSAGRDWTVNLWDLQVPKAVSKTIRFDSPVWSCKWLDVEKRLCVATVFEESCVFLINFMNQQPSCTPIGDVSSMEDQGNVLTVAKHPFADGVILTGSSKGWLNFFRIDFSLEPPIIKLLHSVRVANCNLKHILVSESGDKIAINASDRTIRQYLCNIDSNYTSVTIELEHKYQDVINKLQWNKIVFSNNSAEYLVASTHGSSAHELYIWETSSGTLVRVLEGSEEELMDIDWDFHSMTIASNGLESGDIYLWSIVIPPKWSALAPDFEEIEENVDYQEKEDEFDEVDEQEQQQEMNEAEEVPVDLQTREQFDVRGNDLLLPRFTIPIDYEQILLMQQHG